MHSQVQGQTPGHVCLIKEIRDLEVCSFSDMHMSKKFIAGPGPIAVPIDEPQLNLYEYAMRRSTANFKVVFFLGRHCVSKFMNNDGHSCGVIVPSPFKLSTERFSMGSHFPSLARCPLQGLGETLDGAHILSQFVFASSRNSWEPLLSLLLG
jgi:hypothetical protein